MRRRDFIALAGVTAGGGCLTLQSDTPTDQPGWVQEPGSNAFQVRVSDSYTGEVVVQTDCRNNQRIPVDAGESLSVDRDQSQTCSLVVRLNGTVQLDALVGNSQLYRVTVTANGSVEKEVAVV
jgi:hypothetical protein